MRLADLTWLQVRDLAAAGAVLAIPLGSTEQHGPHLPLSTDADIATALCDRLAGIRPDVLVAPVVPYGSSGEHAGFAGTLSIGQAALELLVIELVRSAGDTFTRVLLVSAHGGNAEALTRAVHTLRAESRDVRIFQPRWSDDLHAGRVETSLQLALRPQAVDMALAAAGDTRSLQEVLPLLRSGGVRLVSANGVLGDPSGASGEDGRRILDELTAALVEAVAGHFPLVAS
ncbi:MAG: mycofactocin biosynthesis peptidyl-dipeptidase MftE [Jatrophihabitans sp.]